MTPYVFQTFIVVTGTPRDGCAYQAYGSFQMQCGLYSMCARLNVESLPSCVWLGVGGTLDTLGCRGHRVKRMQIFVATKVDYTLGPRPKTTLNDNFWSGTVNT